MSNNILETLIDRLEKYSGEADVLMSNGSIGAVLNNFVVTPRIVVSESLKDTDEIAKVIDFNLDVFGMMYTRTFDILLSVYGYETKFAIRTLGNGTQWSLESFDNGEPSIKACEELGVFPMDISSPSLEKASSDNLMRELELSANIINPKTGKEATIRFTMLVKATLVYVDPKDIYRAIDTNGKDVSFSARWDQYKSGEITFKNLIISDDLVKRYKAGRLADKSDFLKYIEKKRRDNVSAITLRQTVDLSKLFQMIIISSKEKSRIEKMVSGKMSKNRIKDNVLNTILSMSMTSIDDDNEIVDFYLADLGEPMEITFKQLSSGDANSSKDIIKWLMSQK